MSCSALVNRHAFSNPVATKLFFFVAVPLISGVPLVAADNSVPQPFGPVPSERQLLWHEMEFYGFLHFTVNTFTDKEWGYGDEDDKVFNPTDFNPKQIVSTAKE